MDTLFGKNQIQQLVDLDYQTFSHTFSKSVIASYYNLLEYDSIITDKQIMIQRTKDIVIFNPILSELEKIDSKKVKLYSIEKIKVASKKIKEIVYDLEKLFTNPNKQLRRGIVLNQRKEIVLRSIEKEEIVKLYEDWVEYKMNDKKTFRITFTPKRYLRSFELKEKGFNVLQEGIFIEGKLYGAICFEIQNDYAFELSFISRFWDKELKIINDLNECILIYYFWKLFKEYGIKKINVGPDAGIKGLKLFKNKMSHEFITIYSN